MYYFVVEVHVEFERIVKWYMYTQTTTMQGTEGSTDTGMGVLTTTSTVR